MRILAKRDLGGGLLLYFKESGIRQNAYGLTLEFYGLLAWNSIPIDKTYMDEKQFRVFFDSINSPGDFERVDSQLRSRILEIMDERE